MLITAEEAKKIADVNRRHTISVLADINAQIRFNAEHGYSMLRYLIKGPEIRDAVLTELQNAGYRTRLLSDLMVEISWN